MLLSPGQNPPSCECRVVGNVAEPRHIGGVLPLAHRRAPQHQPASLARMRFHVVSRSPGRVGRIARPAKWLQGPDRSERRRPPMSSMHMPHQWGTPCDGSDPRRSVPTPTPLMCRRTPLLSPPTPGGRSLRLPGRVLPLPSAERRYRTASLLDDCLPFGRSGRFQHGPSTHLSGRPSDQTHGEGQDDRGAHRGAHQQFSGTQPSRLAPKDSSAVRHRNEQPGQPREATVCSRAASQRREGLFRYPRGTSRSGTQLRGESTSGGPSSRASKRCETDRYAYMLRLDG